MLFWEELALILGLSMDGFAASVCLGIDHGRRRLAPVVLFITGFHVGMLLAGYVLGAGVRGALDGVIPWIGGLLLAALGVNMLRTAGRGEEKSAGGTALSIAAPALATSVDAMTVGVALALSGASAGQAGALTALVMGSLSVIGAAFGGHIGERFRKGARLAGGAILAMLGLRMLLAATA